MCNYVHIYSQNYRINIFLHTTTYKQQDIVTSKNPIPLKICSFNQTLIELLDVTLPLLLGLSLCLLHQVLAMYQAILIHVLETCRPICLSCTLHDFELLLCLYKIMLDPSSHGVGFCMSPTYKIIDMDPLWDKFDRVRSNLPVQISFTSSQTYPRVCKSPPHPLQTLQPQHIKLQSQKNEPSAARLLRMASLSNLPSKSLTPRMLASAPNFP
jgi:hypothetical protein